MKTLIVGITGGVGCGKSTVVEQIKNHFSCRAISTDDVSREQMEPGGIALKRVTEEFGEEILEADGSLNRKALADIVFGNPEKLALLNSITHPLVTEYVLEQVELERDRNLYQILLIETALLIEGKYDEFCDMVWYVYAPEEQRRERLKISRGYSEDKIDSLFARQHSEEDYREVATHIIVNSDGTTEEEIVEQIRRAITP